MLDLIARAIGLKKTDISGAVQREKRVDLLAAVLLLEAAHSDYECTDAEMAHVVETVKTMFNLPREHVRELLELAHQKRAEAVDLHRFTRQLNEQMSREEKMAVMVAVWRIIHADGRIDKHEEYFARKLTNLLWLEHKDFIEAKLKAREA